MKNLHIQKNKGLTLLFAVIVSSLVLAVGASVISIALRQRSLSITGRESQLAFYAANTGIECATYWDKKPPDPDSTEKIFPSTTDSGAVIYDAFSGNPEDITCAGGSIITGEGFPANEFTEEKQWEQNGNVTEFRIAMRHTLENPNVPANLYCAEVRVEKVIPADSDTGYTRIISQGYNTCDINSPTAVQRGLNAQYNGL